MKFLYNICFTAFCHSYIYLLFHFCIYCHIYFYFVIQFCPLLASIQHFSPRTIVDTFLKQYISTNMHEILERLSCAESFMGRIMYHCTCTHTRTLKCSSCDTEPATLNFVIRPSCRPYNREQHLSESVSNFLTL